MHPPAILQSLSDDAITLYVASKAPRRPVHAGRQGRLHAQGADVVAALRAAVLEPVLRCPQRQPGKDALAIMVMFGIAGLETESRATLVTLAGVMLILPFFLFSGLAGQIVDSMDGYS